MSSSPFGLNIDALAQLFGKAPIGPANAFLPPQQPSPPARDDEESVPTSPNAPVPQRANVPPPPPRPVGFGFGPLKTAPEADMPVPGAAPTSGNFPWVAAPAVPVPPAPAAAPATPEKGGGVGDVLAKLGDAGIGDQMIAFGSGLASTKGFGPGLAAGFKGTVDASQKRAVTDLARAEFGLKNRKVQQEAIGNNATYQALVRKGVDPADAQAAIAASGAGHGEALSNLLNNNFRKTPDAPAGYTMGQDGTAAFIPGGPQDPKTIAEQAKAREADKTLTVLDTPEKRSAAGINPSDTRTARINPDGQVTFDSQPPAPTVHILEDENGNKHIRQYDPKSGGWIDPAQPPGAPPPATNPLALKGKTTGDQSKAAGFSDRMLNSERILATNASEGTSLKERTFNSLPVIGNYLTSDGFQSYDQAKRDFTNAQLRRESGAAIGKDEFSSADKQYFPQPGDSEATIKQKAVNRRIAIEAMGREGGPTYLPSHVFDESGALTPFAPAQRKPVPSASASGQPDSASQADPLSAARAAISQGADRDKVRTRLLKSGIDIKGL